MAKFDSQYPVQVAPEEGDKFLITSVRDGRIMAVTLQTLKSQILFYLGVIDTALSNTSEHPVQNKVITQELQNLYERVLRQISQAIQPTSSREVMNCFEVNYLVSDVEEVTNPQTGKTYFEWDSENVKVYNGTSFDTVASINSVIGKGFIVSENAAGSQLYMFVDGGSGVVYESITPDATLIYAVDKYKTDGTYDSKIYLYNQSSQEFVNVTGDGGGYVDGNTIYINDIDTELNGYTEAALYNVVVTKQSVRVGVSKQIYTLAVSSGAKLVLPTNRTVTVYYQVLSNKDGYLSRSKQQGGSWSSWEEFKYAYETDIERVEKLAKKAIKLAKGAY